MHARMQGNRNYWSISLALPPATPPDLPQMLLLFLQLKGSLERTIREHDAEMERATAAMNAAEAEAAAQEELAELANGELEEYQRRMAAEVRHARQEALRSAEARSGSESPVYTS